MTYITAPQPLSPYLQLEAWAMEMFYKLNLVPPLSFEASLYIHRRKLALYS